jgi:PLP dependent protein
MDPEVSGDLAANLAAVRQRMAAACRRAGRQPDSVMLIAVTKTVGVDAIAAAWRLGLRDFGENRVQEARQKILALESIPARWHLIGRLQSNKAGRAAELFQMIHSVDSVDLAMHLSRQLLARNATMPVLLEVNIAGEGSKAGFSAGGDDLLQAAPAIAALPGIDVQGLMTVAPPAEDPESVRRYFTALRLLLERVTTDSPGASWRHLSMGMSDDFEVAIEEGATMVRVGRAIFGERPVGR